MSVNMVISSEIQKKVGYFDENLGVGNYYGAGEDVDYYIRCIKAGGTFYYIKNLWNYHPLNATKHIDSTLTDLRKRYNSYGRGQIFMLLKHNLIAEALKCTLNGLFGSGFALMKGDYKLSIARANAFFVRFQTLIKNI